MQASRPHVSKEQKEFLFKYLQENPEMMSAKFSPSFTITDAQMKWRTLANTLNRLPGKRSIKSWKKWRKTWQDMKSKVKVKYMKDKGSLTEEDERVFRISGGFNESGESSIDEEIIDNNEYSEVNENDFVQEITQNEHLAGKIEIYVVEDDSDGNEEGVNHHLPSNDIVVPRNVGDTHVETTEVPHHSDKQIVMTTAFYRERKLSCLNRIAKAKKRSSWANARIAKALKNIASSRGSII